MLQERGLTPATIPGCYKQLLEDNATRDLLYDMTPQEAAPSDKKAFVDELLTRLDNTCQVPQM